MGRFGLQGEQGPSVREPHLLAAGWFCPGHGPAGTLMRHALPTPQPILTLATGVVAPTRGASLVSAPGLAHRLAAPDRRTRL